MNRDALIDKTDGSIDWLTDGPIDWLTDGPVDWLTDGSIDWLIDYCNSKPTPNKKNHEFRKKKN